MPARNILIVDDEKDICLLLGAFLKQRNYDVYYALNLHDAKTRLAETVPGLIFLDIHLPDGSGMELVPDILRLYPDMKIVMMSAYDGDIDREKAKVTGVHQFIGKPLTQEKVDQALLTLKADQSDLLA